MIKITLYSFLITSMFWMSFIIFFSSLQIRDVVKIKPSYDIEVTDTKTPIKLKEKLLYQSNSKILNSMGNELQVKFVEFKNSTKHPGRIGIFAKKNINFRKLKLLKKDKEFFFALV